MRLLKRLAVILLIIAVFIFGVLFSVNNTERAALDLLLIQLPQQRVSVWVLLAFVCGGLAGILFSAALVLKLRTRNLLLQRQLDKNNRELQKFQSSEINNNRLIGS